MDARRTRAPQLQVGLLHGIWHLPLVFLATDGYLTEGNRWIIVPLFLAVFTASGPVYGWLRRTTGSVYPAVLAHASFNWVLGVVSYTVVTADPDTVAAIGREAGIATLVALVAAAVWLTTRPAPAATAPASSPALTRAS
jgi:membrane protease YdiL (CAAX protease family)